MDGVDNVKNEKVVVDFTLYEIDRDLIERFKLFAKSNGIKRLPDALGLLLNLSDYGFVLADLYKKIGFLEKKIDEKEVVDVRKEIKTFGGKKNVENEKG